MLLSGGTYTDCNSGMSLNRQFGKRASAQASDTNVLDCFCRCWDLQKSIKHILIWLEPQIV